MRVSAVQKSPHTYQSKSKQSSPIKNTPIPHEKNFEQVAFTGFCSKLASKIKSAWTKFQAYRKAVGEHNAKVAAEERYVKEHTYVTPADRAADDAEHGLI